MSRTRGGPAHWRTLRDAPNLLRLVGLRLLSQYTDGLFQAALGSAIVFNPQRGANPAAIAAGLAVMLLPYSVVGPFAGALLDRWDRRRVFIVTSLIRAVLITCAGVLVVTGAGDQTVLLLALTVGGAARFMSSGLSAALPHVLDREQVVTGNSITVTLGTAATATGAGTALVLRAIFGAGNSGSGAVVVCAALAAAGGALLASRFPPHILGPDHQLRDGILVPVVASDRAGHSLITGLQHGAIAVWRSPPTAAAMIGIGANRLAFGANTLMLLLLTRHRFSGGSHGLVGFGAIGAATAVGMFIAVVVMPVAAAKVGRRVTLLASLLMGAVAQASLLWLNLFGIVVAAVVLGLVGQLIKLCGDAAMQLDVPDERRGQVFAFQDALFNVAYVLAVAAAAAVVPIDGVSRPVVLIAVALYLVASAAVVARYRSGTPAATE
jgi:MFS family permease